jgi:hypothetical protein
MKNLSEKPELIWQECIELAKKYDDEDYENKLAEEFKAYEKICE